MKTTEPKNVCSECGDLIPNEPNVMFNYKDDVICEDCYNEKYLVCDCCGYTCLKEDSVYVESEDVFICEDCYDTEYFTCADCGQVVRAQNYRHSQCNCSGYPVCDVCAEEYSTCDNCGAIIYSIDSYHLDNTDETLCEDCYKETTNQSVINSYGYKPEPKFRRLNKDDKSALYFGIEIEVIKKSGYKINEAVQQVINKLGEIVYLKEDGSLDKGGFEIVSHPATFEYWKNNYLNFEGLPVYSFRNNSTGTHVHISRNQFKQVEIAKLLYFFALPGNQGLINKIAQRDETTYCKKQVKGKVMEDLKYSSDRYKAINLCNNETIEIRVFKGNISPNAIARVIQFCHAITIFVKSKSTPHCTANEFKKFVSDNTKQYKELNGFIN